jgi:hypothetical protein
MSYLTINIKTQAYANQEKELRGELIKAFNWITRKDSPYAIICGDEMPFATIDEDFTVEEMVDEYLNPAK